MSDKTIPLRLLPKKGPPRPAMRKIPMMDKEPNAVKDPSRGKKTVVTVPKLKNPNVR